MKPSMIYKNLKNFEKWSSEKPNNEDYIRLYNEFKDELKNFKLNALAKEFGNEISIEHDGQNMFCYEDATIYDENIFTINQETFYILTEDEFKDFTDEKMNIINCGGHRFSFEEYLTSKDKQLVMYKDCCISR